MALKATVFKVNLQVSDLDRPHYGTYPLTLARHPSETDERMMLRVLAFALEAGEGLEFGKGLSSEEPALWQHDATGLIEHWIELGLPDEAALRRACGKARKVTVYAYGSRATAPWWQKHGAALRKLENLRVRQVADETFAALGALAERSMDVNCLVQDGEAQILSGESVVPVALAELQPART